jgi:hypothetical protein
MVIFMWKRNPWLRFKTEIINFKAVKYPLTIQKEEINHRLKTIKTEIILSSIFLCNFFHISLNFKV